MKTNNYTIKTLVLLLLFNLGTALLLKPTSLMATENASGFRQIEYCIRCFKEAMQRGKEMESETPPRRTLTFDQYERIYNAELELFLGKSNGFAPYNARANPDHEF